MHTFHPLGFKQYNDIPIVINPAFGKHEKSFSMLPVIQFHLS